MAQPFPHHRCKTKIKTQLEKLRDLPLQKTKLWSSNIRIWCQSDPSPRLDFTSRRLKALDHEVITGVFDEAKLLIECDQFVLAFQ